jgi:serine/threonine protein kinase
LRQLGRGGSATVNLARERKNDRLVVLKVLHPALAASLQAEQFLNEIAYSGATHASMSAVVDLSRVSADCAKHDAADECESEPREQHVS